MERLGVIGLKICLYCFISTSKRIVTMYFLFDYNIMNSILTIAISKLGSIKLELSIELKWRWYLQWSENQVTFCFLIKWELTYKVAGEEN